MQKNFSRSILFLTIFIDMLGVGIIIPVLGPLFFGQGSILPSETSMLMRGILYGLLSAAFPFAQFFGAPLLGALADRRGRRGVLLASLLGTALGYVMFAIGILFKNIPLLFASRLLDGFTGGNIAVAMAVLTDVTKPQDRAKAFGMIGAAFGLGFIIGPYIGGKLADASLVSWFTAATPFYFAALISALNMCMVYVKIPETLQKKLYKPMSFFTGFSNIAKAFSMPATRTMFTVIFLVTLGFSFFTQFFQVYLVDRFGFSESQIGDTFAVIGVWIVITQAFLLRLVGSRYSSAQVLRIALLGLALAIPALLLPSAPMMLMWSLPFVAIANGFVNPNTSAMISQLADPKSQGEILGIQSSVQALAQMLPPVIAGMVIVYDIRLPMLISGTIIFLAWLVFLAGVRHSGGGESLHRESFHEV